MTENDSPVPDSTETSEEKSTHSRTPRTIRFADSDWARIEWDARKRGMTAAELVRHAAVGFAAGELMPKSPTIPHEIAAQIERIYRGVYLLSTLKRDEMLAVGQHEEFDRIHKEARKSQDSILRETSARVT